VRKKIGATRRINGKEGYAMNSGGTKTEEKVITSALKEITGGKKVLLREPKMLLQKRRSNRIAKKAGTQQITCSFPGERQTQERGVNRRNFEVCGEVPKSRLGVAGLWE